ncbi:MAG: hypothetical protein FIA90_10750 [candidate division NC10 bacterium]|nr:hypothetical protein [candidate division NC10 bacterium]
MKRTLHTIRAPQTKTVRLLAGLLLALPLLAASPADAFKEVDARPVDMFGMVGIVRGQAARLDVVNARAMVDPGDRSSPCQVEFGFVDGQGRSLGRATAALQPGQASFFDVFFDAFDDAGPASRLQVRGFIIDGGRAVAPDIGDRTGRMGDDPCAALLPSVEVYDVATGASTLVLHPAVIRGFNPQPDPPGLPAIRK